ncbi:MAG TPA: hypothetical protein VK213_11235 [Bacteroidales bacterium]|nr:hypothetical protein [Bacteroidales bacterium]
MIVYHKNNEIDREQWDNCIRNSGCLKPYPYSWFLDIMAPGWEALVDDDYDSVFPLPVSDRFGFRRIVTPAFLQQLGAYSPDKPVSSAIIEFLDFLPDFYRLIDLNIEQKVEFEGFRIAEKSSYFLDTSGSFEELSGKFSESCRRNIEKASRKNPLIVHDITPDEIINMYILNNTRRSAKVPALYYLRMRSLMNFCIKNKKGSITGVRDGHRKPLSAAFFVDIRGCRTLLFSASTAAGKERKLDYFLINELIKNNNHNKSLIDFAGADAPDGNKFSDLFGALRYPYYHLYCNRMIWPLSWFRLS